MTGIIDRGENTHEVYIETPRLLLREHRLDDLAPLHAIFSDPVATWYLPELRKEDLEETEAYLRSVMRDSEAVLRLRYNLIVQERATGEVVGSVGLHAIDTSPFGGHFGLGYFIRPDRWNQGYATEAARATLGFIFASYAWRVTAACLAENLSSRRVLENCGMRQEGLLKAHTWHDGQWKDCAIYGILREETACLNYGET